MPKGVLSPEHRTALIEESGISEEIIDLRGYWTATNRKELKDMGFGKKQISLYPALVIPQYNYKGKHNVNQIRPDHPRVNDRGKTQKYEFRWGTPMALDFPPLDWVIRDVQDAKKPI